MGFALILFLALCVLCFILIAWVYPRGILERLLVIVFWVGLGVTLFISLLNHQNRFVDALQRSAPVSQFAKGDGDANTSAN